MVFIIGILVYICIGDWRRRKIANEIVAVLVVLILITMPPKNWNLIASTVCLCIGIGLWSMDVIGAGDVKLTAALSLGVADEYALAALTITAYTGLIVVIGMVLSDRLWHTNTLVRGVPYAIPISVGGLIGLLASLP